jgi:hypothetical protein
MAKYEQRNRIMLAGVDISMFVHSVRLDRLPGHVDLAEVTMYVERFDVEPLHDTPGRLLVVHLEGPPGLTVRPEKRIIL